MKSIRALVPFLGDRVDQLSDRTEIKLLTVVVDRLRMWHKPGLLCIGDAAHAMSPVGGVGINLAIQDAVAVANILAAPIASGLSSFAIQRAGCWAVCGSSDRRILKNDSRGLTEHGADAPLSDQRRARHSRTLVTINADVASTPQGSSFGKCFGLTATWVPGEE